MVLSKRGVGILCFAVTSCVVAFYICMDTVRKCMVNLDLKKSSLMTSCGTNCQMTCDSECRRFIEHTRGLEWPRGKPISVIMILVQKSRLGQLGELLKSVDHFFNDKFKYPFVIFHEKDFSPDDRKRLSLKINSKIFYQTVVFELPEFINETRLREGPCTGAFSVGYRHMCRFHAKSVYESRILEGVQFAWRLDDDSRLTRPIMYDVFRYMGHHRLQYGYHRIVLETLTCIEGLYEAAEHHITDNGVSRTVEYTNWPRNETFYNNFEISNVSFWRSDAYQRYIYDIDRAGGIYYVRWGDAPIKTIAVNLFLRKEEVHHFRGFGYVHPWWIGSKM